MPKYTITNRSDSVRVVPKATGGSVTIPIGKTVTVDLHDTVADILKDGQDKKGGMKIVSGTERVRVRTKEKEPDPEKEAAVKQTEAISALVAHVKDMDYQTLLKEAQKLLPKDTLPLRPSRQIIGDKLGEALAKLT